MATKTQRARQQFVQNLKEILGSPDRWGNFRFTFEVMPGHIDIGRIKINQTSWRLERRIPGGNYFRVDGRYYTDPEGFPIIRDWLLKRSVKRT